MIAREALAFKVLAGVLVALATWWRWLAIDGADVAVVLALALVSVPIVLFLSPLLVGRHLERVTPQGVGRRRARRRRRADPDRGRLMSSTRTCT